MDSIVFAGDYGSRRNYVEQALQFILWSTGLCCVALVGTNDGSSFPVCSTFSTMASSIPSFCGSSFFVVVLACGNDVYFLARQRTRRGIEHIQEVIEEDARGIAHGWCSVLQDLRGRTTGGILLVFGGDSDIWGYEGDFALVYNVYVKVVSDLLRQTPMHEVSVIRGEALRSIQTTDHIGHVSESSLGRVVQAFVLFAWQAYSCPADVEDASPDVVLSKL